MGREKIYNRSLELVDEFLKETTSEELETLISEFENIDIQGPTIEEYFSILQENLLSANWVTECAKPSQFYVIDYYIEGVNDIIKNCIPPPKVVQNNYIKKGSVEYAESFFLLLLYQLWPKQKFPHLNSGTLGFQHSHI